MKNNRKNRALMKIRVKSLSDFNIENFIKQWKESFDNKELLISDSKHNDSLDASSYYNVSKFKSCK